MAGYFDFLGKVFTEKGSWYKILIVCALQGVTIFFNPKPIMNQMAAGSMPEFNIPGIILYLLSSMLILGFIMQVYNCFMNNKPKLLPDIDFADMFMKAIRMIPLMFVWIIYFAILGVLFGFTSAFAPKSGFIFILFMTVFIAIMLFFAFMFAVIVILHTKDFSYKYLLNPLTPFKIFPKVAGPIGALVLLYGFINVILYGLFFSAIFLIGLSGGGSVSVSSMFAIGVVGLCFLYLNNAFSLAYSIKFAEIVKSKLAGTKYIDDDFDVPVSSGIDDDDEFAGYMHNKDDESDY